MLLLLTESDVPISIDTRRAAVARAAIDAGADMVNDVSGGTFDRDMLHTVAELRVPIILMHMRGSPQTMHSMTEYKNVVAEVAVALVQLSVAAEEAGPRDWLCQRHEWKYTSSS
jgi:dihydropteroate synthase